MYQIEIYDYSKPGCFSAFCKYDFAVIIELAKDQEALYITVAKKSYMTYAKWRKLVGIINLSVVFLLMIDTYLFNPGANQEVINDKFVNGNIAGKYRHISWHLVTAEGFTYDVPSTAYMRLKLGDTITVLRTAIFKKSVNISYHFDTVCFSINNRAITYTSLIMDVVFIIIAISVWMLFFHVSIRQEEDVKLRIILIATFLLIPLLLVYFVNQP